VVFRLTPHGIITGHVVDEDGDPLQNAQVQLLRTSYVQGHKQFQAFGGGLTNDLGEYRLSGITPGKYFLSATYRSPIQFSGVVMTANGNLVDSGRARQQEDYVTTFYPGVTDPAAALPLDVKPAQQFEGINLKLSKVHTVSVKGNVINEVAAAPTVEAVGGRGGPIRSNVSVQLIERNSLIQFGQTQGAAVRPDGSFQFPSVASGAYTLSAVTTNANNRYNATQPLDVGQTDIEGLTITITPGVTVTGHIRVDGDTTDPIPGFQAGLASTPSAGIFIQAPQPAKADADNNFRFDNVGSGHFDVSVFPLTGGLYLKSIRNGNTDVLNTGLDLTGGGGATLDVVIGVNAPQITGVVQNPVTQQPAAMGTVVLIPQEKERQNVTVYYRSTGVGSNGSFTMYRVNPGEYRLYAWEDIEFNAWFDPDVLKPFESKGMAVSVKEGQPVNVQLTMIPEGSSN
jgi:hypothetical protein